MSRRLLPTLSCWGIVLSTSGSPSCLPRCRVGVVVCPRGRRTGCGWSLSHHLRCPPLRGFLDWTRTGQQKAPEDHHALSLQIRSGDPQLLGSRKEELPAPVLAGRSAWVATPSKTLAMGRPQGSTRMVSTAVRSCSVSPKEWLRTVDTPAEAQNPGHDPLIRHTRQSLSPRAANASYPSLPAF